MPRYLVEQLFPEADEFSLVTDSLDRLHQIMQNNHAEGVTWICSYVTPDKHKAFYLCEAPSPEAIRRAAQQNEQPVNRITEVQLLDPYALI